MLYSVLSDIDNIEAIIAKNIASFGKIPVNDKVVSDQSRSFDNFFNSSTDLIKTVVGSICKGEPVPSGAWATELSRLRNNILPVIDSLLQSPQKLENYIRQGRTESREALRQLAKSFQVQL